MANRNEVELLNVKEVIVLVNMHFWTKINAYESIT